MSWQEAAACKGADIDLFFPTRGNCERIEEAKAICDRCPVANECLAFALDEGFKFGIFGGKSERERRKLRPKWQRIVPCDWCGTRFPLVNGSRFCSEPCRRNKQLHVKHVSRVEHPDVLRERAADALEDDGLDHIYGPPR